MSYESRIECASLAQLLALYRDGDEFWAEVEPVCETSDPADAQLELALWLERGGDDIGVCAIGLYDLDEEDQRRAQAEELVRQVSDPARWPEALWQAVAGEG
jgi:hypothetical protein